MEEKEPQRRGDLFPAGRGKVRPAEQKWRLFRRLVWRRPENIRAQQMAGDAGFEGNPAGVLVGDDLPGIHRLPRYPEHRPEDARSPGPFLCELASRERIIRQNLFACAHAPNENNICTTDQDILRIPR
ncbi:hypothetical protein [Sinorhizobium meliloti]|uniref:hypothetical protein n=1 Tax=Rhizobium meliloti TaxID=382 RepID=UPI0013E304BF|nr:hypothetical protein [Sinorhizobium meliloti]